MLRAKHEAKIHASEALGGPSYCNVKDPRQVKTKGCRAETSMMDGRNKRVVRCSFCRLEGQNRRNCPKQVEKKIVSSGDGDLVDRIEDELDYVDLMEDEDMVSKTLPL